MSSCEEERPGFASQIRALADHEMDIRSFFSPFFVSNKEKKTLFIQKRKQSGIRVHIFEGKSYPDGHSLRFGMKFIKT